MANSYKTIPYISPLQMASLYNIAVALNLEQLYNKTSDLGIDYLLKGLSNIHRF